jgi:hypothetical protein
MLNFRHSLFTGQLLHTCAAVRFRALEISLSSEGKNNSVFIPAQAAMSIHIGKL